MWQNETLKIVRTSRVVLNLKWAVPGPLGIRLASLCTRGAQTRASVPRSAREPELITASTLVAASVGRGPKTEGAREPLPHSNHCRRNKSEWQASLCTPLCRGEPSSNRNIAIFESIKITIVTSPVSFLDLGYLRGSAGGLDVRDLRLGDCVVALDRSTGLSSSLLPISPGRRGGQTPRVVEASSCSRLFSRPFDLLWQRTREPFC